MSILAACWFQVLLCVLLALLSIVFIVYHLSKVLVPSISLKQANIVITGGSKGIGLEIAHECLKRGANICIVARNKKKLQESQEFLLKQRTDKKQSILTVSADVSNYHVLKENIDKTLKENNWNGVEVLVSNAGVESVGPFEKLDLKEFHRVMNINYFGTVNIVKTMLPHLKRSSMQNRRIISVSSMLGLMSMTCYSSYCASKFAVRGFIDSIQQELVAYNIFTSIVYPPDVDTDSLKREKSNPLLPKKIGEISDDSGVFSPKQIGKDIVNNIENGGWTLAWGMDGFLLKNLTVGMNPTFSITDSFTQYLFGGLLRMIAVFYTKQHFSVSKKELSQLN